MLSVKKMKFKNIKKYYKNKLYIYQPNNKYNKHLNLCIPWKHVIYIYNILKENYRKLKRLMNRLIYNISLNYFNLLIIRLN